MFSPGHFNSVPPPAGEPAPVEKYRLCARLGGGGQADVFLALASGPIGFNKLVVIKRLRPEMLEQPAMVAMFLDEARLAARLSHPNVVQTYEVAEGEAYLIAMEYLEGQPLSRLRQAPAAAAPGPGAWVRIVADALAGLHYAHELCDYDGTPLGIVHRDVSPQNIFVTYEGQAKLVDFGVAKAALNCVRTEVGAIKGKASYMAPEQVHGRADRRSDVFSMGVVLWEALAGRKLFTGEMIRVLHKVLYEPVPRLSSVLPGVDPRLDAIVARAVEKDPAARFQTAQSMRDALEAYLAASGGPSRPEDVGRWLQAAFAGERELGRRQVRAALEAAARDSATLLAASPTSSSAPPPSVRGGPASMSGSQLGVHVHPSTLGLRRPGARGSRALPAALALGLVATGAALALATRPGPPAPGAPSAAAPSAALTTPAPPAAALEVHSEPPGALVTWGDRPLGATPLKLELPPGSYTLLFSKEGYRPEPLVIELPAAGAFISRTAALRPLPPASAGGARPPRAPRAPQPSAP
jgi:serine/threonine protein kinase